MKPFAYIKPNTIQELISLKKTSSNFLAGGTNLVDLIKKNIAEPDSLIDTATVIPNKITINDSTLIIDANVTNTALATHKTIVEKFPLISKAILAGASPQIRNKATLSGNIMQRTRCIYFYDLNSPCNKRNPNSGCGAINGFNKMNAVIGYSQQCVAVHPSDLCVALAVLEADINILLKDGRKITMPFVDFHRLPHHKPELDNNLAEDALITSIQVKSNPFFENSVYLKMRDRSSYSFALVSIAVGLNLKNNTIVEARLASGGIAHKPWRWYEAENFLKNKKPSKQIFLETAQMISSALKPLSNNGFKVPMLHALVQEALNEAITLKNKN